MLFDYNVTNWPLGKQRLLCRRAVRDSHRLRPKKHAERPSQLKRDCRAFRALIKQTVRRPSRRERGATRRLRDRSASASYDSSLPPPTSRLLFTFQRFEHTDRALKVGSCPSITCMHRALHPKLFKRCHPLAVSQSATQPRTRRPPDGQQVAALR